VNGETTGHRRWLKWLRRGLYWVLPVVILYLVFQRIDLSALGSSLARANPWLVALGLGLSLVVTATGAFRWRMLLERSYERSVEPGFVLKHYWIGYSLVMFAPGTIGLDTYRVAVAGRSFGRYSSSAALIVVEKLAALTSCLLLIVILYPMIPTTASSEIETVLHLAYVLLVALSVVTAAMTLAARSRLASTLLRRLETSARRLLNSIGGSFSQEDYVRDTGGSLRSLLGRLMNPGRMLPILLLSLAIQLVSAIQHQVLFRSLGYPLPLVANVFAAPVLYFVFALPISFGSLGIREAAYIILYGLYGAPAEIALLVSFFNLAGMLLNSAVGGVVMLLSNVEIQGSTKVTPEDKEGGNGRTTVEQPNQTT